MMALLAGIGTFIAVNAVLALIFGLACGASQTMLMLLRVSIFALPIRLACFGLAAWAGFSMFVSVAG